MVFPNWGAISANIVNSQNQNKQDLVGNHIPTRKPTRRDWIIGTLIFVIPWLVIMIVFLLLMNYLN